MADVLERGSLPVPTHLRNAPGGRMRAHGIGVGYRYPHDYESADVAQQYLPDALVERRYYVPSDQGIEPRIGERLDRLRAERGLTYAQIALHLGYRTLYLASGMDATVLGQALAEDVDVAVLATPRGNGNP